MSAAPETSAIHAELVASPMLTRWACHACGGHTEKNAVLVAVPKQHPTHSGFRVCETCLESGDIDARLADHVVQLMREAEALRGMIGRLKTPTFAEWQAAEVLAAAAWEMDMATDDALALSPEQQAELIASAEAKQVSA